MLPSSRRIERKYFKKIFSQGNFYRSENISLAVLRENHKFPSRFSFSVSKKISKKAVVRNKLRRRGYSVLKELLPFIKPSFLAVFIFKNGSETLSFEDLSRQIKYLLNKSGIYERNIGN